MRSRSESGGPPSGVLVALQRARAAARLGDRGRATESYLYVADGWARADPALRPYVPTARWGLASLR